MAARQSMPLTLCLNGRRTAIDIDPRRLLVNVVRDELGQKASRIGCLTGDCGACTIDIDGRLAKACLSLALSAEGCAITTLEGDGSPIMRALQVTFLAENAFQCGYCTTGMLMAAADLLRRNPQPNEPEICKAINGNLCRCTGYEPIVRAVLTAAANLKERP